jgi:hypothetical protein
VYGQSREYNQGEANTRFCGRGIKKASKRKRRRRGIRKKATVQHKKRLELNYTFTHG